MFNRIKKHITRRYRLQLLHQLRAYKALVETTGEKETNSLINNLMTKTIAQGIKAPKYLSNKSVTQYLLAQLLEQIAPIAMLTAVNSRHPCLVSAPKPWRRYFKAKGITISRWSQFIWYYQIAAQLKHGVRTFLTLVLGNLKNEFISAPKSDYSILQNIPNNALSLENHTFTAWYAKKFPREHLWVKTQSRETYPLNKRVSIIANIWPKFSSKKNLFAFILRGVGIILRSTLEWLTGKPLAFFMLAELMYLNYVRCLEDHALPKRVVYLNSQFTYRPLWTYWIEQKGGSADLIFYSTNCGGIHWKSHGIISAHPGYETMSWTRYFAWDSYQVKFLQVLGIDRNKIINANEPIPLSDTAENVTKLSKKSIAVFDIQPFRHAFMASIGRPSNISSYAIIEKFLTDIVSLCEEYDIKVLLKPKRLYPNRTHKNYLKLLAAITEHPHVQVISETVSAERVIAKTNGVISTPFTSTAIIAKKYHLPSVFYDPTAIFVKPQPAAHGVAMVESKESLNRWLQDNILQNKCPPANVVLE